MLSSGSRVPAQHQHRCTCARPRTRTLLAIAAFALPRGRRPVVHAQPPVATPAAPAPPVLPRSVGAEARLDRAARGSAASCAIRIRRAAGHPAGHRTLPALVAPPPPSDLLVLLGDREARVRRRAALALGRVGLPEAVRAARRARSSDEEPEVRQMAAFALGLIGDRRPRGRRCCRRSTAPTPCCRAAPPKRWA